jgi:hypothetical protein
MNPSAIARRRIIDLVRANSHVIAALADLGISPRYLYFTIDEASRELGINLDRACSRIYRELGPA